VTHNPTALHEMGKSALAQRIRDGSEVYDRARHLWRILPLAALGGDPTEPEKTRKIILMLAQAIRRERRLGRGGHWSYDLNRHIALAQAYRAERANLCSAASSRTAEASRDCSVPIPNRSQRSAVRFPG